MTPGQVTTAIHKPTGHSRQSVIEAALTAVKDAGPSGRYVTHQPGSTNKEMDAYYRARLGNSQELGTYVFEIDYKGRLTSKSISSIELNVIPGTFSGIYWRSHAQFLPDRYGFGISSGDFENEGPKGFSWSISVGYGQKKNATFNLSSTLANGEYFKSLLNLTPTNLTSVDLQFISVVDRAEKHEPITYQRILPNLTNEEACQG
jgi:hypothetical protein